MATLIECKHPMPVHYPYHKASHSVYPGLLRGNYVISVRSKEEHQLQAWSRGLVSSRGLGPCRDLGLSRGLWLGKGMWLSRGLRPGRGLAGAWQGGQGPGA